MITINNKISISCGYDFPSENINEILFFDIETTGFSPENTLLYLIGCVYYDKGSFHSIQWFADEKDSEHKMLIAFFEFMKNYKVLVHFNGNGFDIPYIQKKCSKYKLDYNFNSVRSIDLYKEFIQYKKVFKLENYKQKTLEKFLEIARDDKYNGGELIQMYATYLKCRINDIDNGFESTTTRQLLNILLLHNEDDIKGLVSVSCILNYCDFFTKEYSLTESSIKNNELIINVNLMQPIPKIIRYSDDLVYFYANKDQAVFKFPIYSGELKYFYDNYNDYYYLPEEDTAIHKSIALYVDKDFKTKAKAANCYAKKTGMFIAQLNDLFNPFFKISYKDKKSYIEITDDLIHDNEFINKYIHNILKGCHN